MSTFFNSITSTIFLFFEALGRARAAAELSRMGKYEEARRLVSRD